MNRLTAISFSLLLVWQVFAEQIPAVCATQIQSCCGNCSGTVTCCAAKQSSNPQPAPTIPAGSISQNQFQFFLTTTPAWTLPGVEAKPFSSADSSQLPAHAISLYARHCALLL